MPPQETQNTKQEKMPKKLQLGFLYFEYDIPKSKKKILKQAKGKTHLTYRGARIRITSNFS